MDTLADLSKCGSIVFYEGQNISVDIINGVGISQQVFITATLQKTLGKFLNI